MRISLLLPACALCIHAAPIVSQQLPQVLPGTRVRVSSLAAGLDRQEGTIVSVSRDTVRFEPRDCRPSCAALLLANDAVDRIEVFNGPSHAKGAAVGGLVGAAVGVVIALGTASHQTCDGGLDALGRCATKAFDAVAIAGLFTAGGIALGAAIGVGSTWRDIRVGPSPVRVGIGPIGPRRAGVTLTAAF